MQPNPMSFTVTKKATNSWARLGKIVLDNKSVQTPTLLISTSRLCVPHLTPDIFHRTLHEDAYCGLLVNFEALLENNCALSKNSSVTIDSLIGYRNTPIWLGTDDPSYYQGIYLKISGDFRMNNGPDWVSLCNEGGIVAMSLRETLTMIAKNQSPCAIICPTDHYPMQNARLKRIKKSTVLTNDYWKLVSNAVKETTAKPVPQLVVHASNGEADDKENTITTEMQKRIEFSDSCESPITSIIHEGPIITKSFQCSEGKARLLRGSIPPGDVKQYFYAGIDIFESSYPTDMVTQGIAFNINQDDSTDQFVMREARYFDDFMPIASDCRCIACDGPDRTTKSYLHHLTMTNEMLASVFIASHNLWQYSNYLKSFLALSL